MSLPQKRSAFTLIELLTVIAIIAILMGLLFPAMNSVKEAARKTQAKNDETQIVTAIKAYYTEYGKYPTNDTTDTVYSTNNNTVIDVLRNMTNGVTGNTLNPRQILFLEAPAVKDPTTPKGGVTSAGVYYDPWGYTYSLEMDADYNNQITNPYGSSANAGPSPLNTGIIVWSYGKDGKQDTNLIGGNDVVSWQ